MYFRHVLAHWALQKLSKAAVLSNYPNVLKLKEVCNGGVGCSLLKLGSLEKTVIDSPFHSGLHSGTIFCGKNDVTCYSMERQVMPFFDKKKDQKKS